jgi:hypothetical protein
VLNPCRPADKKPANGSWQAFISMSVTAVLGCIRVASGHGGPKKFVAACPSGAEVDFNAKVGGTAYNAQAHN